MLEIVYIILNPSVLMDDGSYRQIDEPLRQRILPDVGDAVLDLTVLVVKTHARESVKNVVEILCQNALAYGPKSERMIVIKKNLRIEFELPLLGALQEVIEPEGLRGKVTWRLNNKPVLSIIEK